MKVKIVSFVLTLLMLTSLFSVAVTATVANSGIMCTDYSAHSKIQYAIYYCTGCPSTTYVCRICYPDHNHTSTVKCSVHNLYYTFCTTCYGYHCPNSSHGHTSNSYYYCSKHQSTAYTYCAYCDSYYCATCYGGYHNHGSGSGSASSPFYCTNHSTYVLSSYCTICGSYYCATCYGSYHNHSYYYGELKDSYFVCKKHNIDVGATQCSYCGYYYCPTCYGGYHNHGSANTAISTCESPKANIANNSNVEYGTKITLSTGTANATIYYTTDGSVPTIYSNRYTGAITLTKNTTIKAMTVRTGYINSSTSSYNYTVKSKTSFNDISDYPGLSASLSVLIDNKVIMDNVNFNPSKAFTFGELKTWLSAIKVSFDKVTDIDHFDDDDELTYNDFVYLLYKALRKADLINTPKSAGYETLKKFTYSKDITNASYYKAGFVSFYENGIFYDINFKPNESATRVYLATAIATVIVNNDL